MFLKGNKMEEKKPKIKNARLRGLIMAISSAVLAVVVLIVSAIIYKKGSNNYRSGEVLGILFFCFVLALLNVVNGILLMIFGDKKVGSGAEENTIEKIDTNNHEENQSTKIKEEKTTSQDILEKPIVENMEQNKNKTTTLKPQNKRKKETNKKDSE